MLVYVTMRAADYEIFEAMLRNQSWNTVSINNTADGSLYFSLNDYADWMLWLAPLIAVSGGYPLTRTLKLSFCSRLISVNVFYSGNLVSYSSS
jgi:hypothetical protein